MDEMGSFRVDVEIENPSQPGERRLLSDTLVDTGAELSWFPADVLESLGVERRKLWQFRQADGSILERWTGAASLYLSGVWTVDEVVFGDPGDLVLLGARSLEGALARRFRKTAQMVEAGLNGGKRVRRLVVLNENVAHTRLVTGGEQARPVNHPAPHVEHLVLRRSR